MEPVIGFSEPSSRLGRGANKPSTTHLAGFQPSRVTAKLMLREDARMKKGGYRTCPCLGSKASDWIPGSKLHDSRLNPGDMGSVIAISNARSDEDRVI